ncbi:hypothetical protein VTI28DRAFT_8991 [Corynascus sepedonium]
MVSASVVAAAFAGNEYPLKNSTILDSGATIHICNQISRFNDFRTAIEDRYLWAGNGRLRIRGYGSVDISMSTPFNGKQLLRLENVAYIPNFATNVASLRRLREQGFQWDTRPQTTLLRGPDGNIFGIVEDRYDQFVLEYVSEDTDRAAFFVRRNKFNSWTKRLPRKAEAHCWHLRLGHPGPGALEHLVNSTQGVRIKGITTAQCDACARGKLYRQERRTPRDIQDFHPGEKLALDFHDFKPDKEGYNSLLLIVDRVSGYMWDFYLQDRKTDTVITAISDLLGILERQYEVKVKAIESDNEISSKLPGVKRYLERRHIRLEPSPADTQALNGAAERSWRTLKEQINAMRDSARLPTDLWREICKAAIYLLNRTPRQRIAWKTPFEVLYSKGEARRKPDLTSLRVYGCKAYAMTTTAMRKEQRLKRFNPKAWIGYLVGYTSSNTYRIWNPLLNKIVVMRDVVFNEQETFSGRLEELRDDIKEIDLDKLSTLLQEYAIQELPDEQVNPALAPRGVEEDLVEDTIVVATGAASRGSEDINRQAVEPTSRGSDDVVNRQVEGASRPVATVGQAPTPAIAQSQTVRTVGAITRSQTARAADNSAHKPVERNGPLPTPPPTPPAALLAAVMTGSSIYQRGSCPDCQVSLDTREALAQGSVVVQHSALHADVATGPMALVDSWKGAFCAGMMATVVKTVEGNCITRAVAERRLKRGDRIHRRELPKPPNRHSELDEHPLGEAFKKAELTHLQSHVERDSWTEILTNDPRVRGHKVLDCKWVYVYKFDKHGRFVKAKARLVVRGDQQLRDVHQNTYAATLAGRSFRAIMAIAARFDLELLQYDAVNAFVNANLDEDVFMRMPPGHRRHGTILKLNKALYGLRRSPLLWQRELTQALKNLGFKAVPHEPCAYTRDGIIVFFYVDDIVIAFREANRQQALRTMIQLRRRYDLTGGNNLQWFLGIEVLRDRKKRLIWLSQSSYIKKIAALAQLKPAAQSPMAKEELLPFDGVATTRDITTYLRKVGSLLYAAVITRPDVAFATSRLARYTTNPGPLHQKAADRVLSYLGQTSTLALQLGGDDDLRIASDASHADNTVDRKSSQGYAIKLFGGLIAWRANKQDTVTTSTTEAELLALSQTTKEGMYVSRLLRELGVELDELRLTVECDNKQTIRLVTQEIAKLNTSLRHVDIHNHWLRQEYASKRIDVVYTESAKMMADGLTKALSQGAFESFRAMMGLVDVREQLEERRKTEDSEP